MFKAALLELRGMIKASLAQPRDVMAISVDEKLDRSFEKYEQQLAETCKYILSKNPVSVIKEVNRINKKKEEEQEEDLEEEEMEEDEDQPM